MTKLRRWACGLAVLAAGCASRPPLENPVLIRPAAADAENPILVTPGAPSATTYAALYEHVLDVLDDYFEIKPTSRYAGHIETFPAVAPGYEQFWKPGSPDPRERLVATLQSMRHFAVVDIWAGVVAGQAVRLGEEVLLEQRPDVVAPHQAQAVLVEVGHHEVTVPDAGVGAEGPGLRVRATHLAADSGQGGDGLPVGRRSRDAQRSAWKRSAARRGYAATPALPSAASAASR